MTERERHRGSAQAGRQHRPAPAHTPGCCTQTQGQLRTNRGQRHRTGCGGGQTQGTGRICRTYRPYHMPAIRAAVAMQRADAAQLCIIPWESLPACRSLSHGIKLLNHKAKRRFRPACSPPAAGKPRYHDCMLAMAGTTHARKTAAPRAPQDPAFRCNVPFPYEVLPGNGHEPAPA